jgi:hypothetical protein
VGNDTVAESGLIMAVSPSFDRGWCADLGSHQDAIARIGCEVDIAASGHVALETTVANVAEAYRPPA